MLKKLLIFLFAFSCLTAQADWVDGYKSETFEVLEHDGMPEPSVSPSGKSRIYFDSTELKLQLSQDGGAYSPFLTDASADTVYLRLDTTNNPLTGSLLINEATADASLDGLEVKPTARAKFPLITTDTDGTRAFSHYLDASGDSQVYIYDNAGAAKVQLNSAGDTYFIGGDVGVGTVSPGAVLDVVGAIRLSGAYPHTIESDSNSILEASTGLLEINKDGAFGDVAVTSGNVGIGTATPSSLLDVNGALTATSLTDGTTTLASGAFDTVVGGIDPTASNHLATKEYVDSHIGFSQDWFYTDTASDIGGIYYVMQDVASGAGESTVVTAGLGAGDDQALNNYATLTGFPGAAILSEGTYDSHIHAERTAGTKPVALYWELYTYELDTTETLRATSEVSSILVGKDAITLHATIASDIAINTTDRLIVKWYANVSATGSDATVTLYQEGDHDSHLTLPTSTDVLNSVYVRQDGTTALTADWDVGNFDLTFKSATGDGTIEGATLTEGGNAVYNSTELEGTLILSTGEGGGTKFLREDGDGTSSWQVPAGSGDVTSVGDCADGACLDGTSDGGTNIALYDGDSNKVTISSGNLSGDITMVLPPDDGDNLDFLQTNGSGTTIWAAGGAAEADTLATVTARGATTAEDLILNGEIILQTDKVVVLDTFTNGGLDAALTALGAEGGTVIIPEGTIAMSAISTLPAVNNITIQGEGRGSIIDCSSITATDCIALNGADHITFKDLAMKGASAGGGTSAIINGTSATHFTLENVYMYDVDQYGLELTTSDYTKVTDCFFFNSDTGASDSFLYYTSGDYTITANNTFETGRQAIFWGSNSHYNVFEGNTVKSITVGVNVSDGDRSVVSNNYFATGIYAVLVNIGAHINISNNVMESFTNPIFASRGLLNIQGNTIWNATGDAITFTGSDNYNVINGNLFELGGNGFDSIVLTSSGHNSITGNIFLGAASGHERAIEGTGSDYNIVTGNYSSLHDTAFIAWDANSDNNHVAYNNLENEAVATVVDAGANNVFVDANGGTITASATFTATTLQEGGNAVYNSTETPGGELGGTWASPTIDDSLSVTSWTLITPTINTTLTMGDAAHTILDAVPASDHLGTGTVASMTVDANTYGIASALHLDTDGNWIEADADAATTAPCGALALETGTGTKKVLLQGFIRDDTWTWTVGGLVYLSTTVGTLTQTPPSGTGDQVQIVGYATHADRMYFNPQLTMVVVN